MLYPKDWVKTEKETMTEEDIVSAETIVIAAIKNIAKDIPQGTSDILKVVVPLTKLNRKQCATLIKVVDLEWHPAVKVDDEIKDPKVKEINIG